MATRHGIAVRHRELEVSPCAPTDFRLEGSSDLDEAKFFSVPSAGKPRYSLYCLDPSDRTALFVETPADVDLHAEPFFYIAQFRHALAVVKLPIERLVSLAVELRNPDEKLLFVQSVGRCGSTLMSRVLGAAERTVAVSEPDVLTQILAFRPNRRAPAVELSLDERAYDALVDAVVRFICHARAPQDSFDHVVVKPRSQVTELMPRLSRLYPNARTLFMTRQRIPWLESVFSALLRDLDVREPATVEYFARHFIAWIALVEEEQPKHRTFRMAEMWALNHTAATRRLEESTREGGRVLQLSFEDLRGNESNVLQRVLRQLGLTLDQGLLDSILAQDSQAGSPLAASGAGRQAYRMDQEELEIACATWKRLDQANDG